MLPLTPQQQLSQNKVQGLSVAWGRAVWGEMEDGSVGYNFPTEGDFKLNHERSYIEQTLGVQIEALFDCIEQVEEMYTDPESTRDRFGMTTYQGFHNVGLVIRSRLDDRVVCMCTPTTMIRDKTEMYFEWYLEDRSMTNMLDNLPSFMDVFDALSGNRASNVVDSPVMPSYDEAVEKLAGCEISESVKEHFLQRLWDHHKNLANGFKADSEKQLMREWNQYLALKKNSLAEAEEESSALMDLVDSYNLKETEPEGNAKEAYVGEVNGNPVLVQVYGGWISVSVAFGEVRHTKDRARNPMGEFGLVSANGSTDHGVGGQSIPGYDLEGMKWRVSGVYPKGRTSAVSDRYIKSDDIIADLVKMKSKVAGGKTDKEDMTYGLWDKAEEGW